MLTIEMLTARCEEMTDVMCMVHAHTAHGQTVEIQVLDFEGFDEDYSEIFRDLDDEEAVDGLVAWLEAEAVSSAFDGVTTTYHFDGFAVAFGYASADI